MTASAIENIPFRKENTINPVQLITLNRPDQRNSLSILMLEKLNATVQRGLKIDAA
ncbi:MAG: hypothetical protein V7700_17710 [Halioglobus sp.]